ncbi:MAG: methyltransferase domain-containing protein [Hydrogenophilaceae bacterium]|nr:methyltransferase domain-containing protein [Hydrogenophilaceae bacterium]
MKYFRIKLMYALLGPIQGYFRKKRMTAFNHFLDTVEAQNPRILDLGGQPGIWVYIERPLDIVILNLPGVANTLHYSHHNISYVEGDACDLSAYCDGEFDLVFSNSVIEHVGDAAKIQQFCQEAMRVGKKLWVQTPSKYFPIEPHTGMPFWWWYPASLKRYILARWQRKLPGWTAMVATTTYVRREELIRLFPKATIRVERFAGLPKSYIAVQ